jgi:arginase
MQVIEVPFFIGRPMDGFFVPRPSTTVSPPLPDEDVAYDTSRAHGPGGPAQRRMAVLYEELADRVARSEPSLVYAGDCLSVIGVLAGLQRKDIDPTLYWFDAHGDFHTWETSRSSFLGGMPLAMLTGRGEQTIVDAIRLRPLDDDRVVLVDARDLDPGEDTAVTDSDVTVMTVADVANSSPRPGPIYVHVDVDVVDPSELPAVNYPSPGGPPADVVRSAVANLAASERVVAASISSWNPALPEADRAAAVTRSIIDVFLT